MTPTTAPSPRPPRSPGPEQRHAFVAGARAMLPLLFGLAPFGMVIGVTAADRGLSPLAGLSTGWLIYSGSAQLAAIDLIGAGATPLVVIVTVVAINARLLLYAGAMATPWRDTPRGWRIVAAYLLIDPSFFVGMDGYDKRGPTRAGHAYYLGGAAVLWLTWQLAIGIGLTLGSVVPESLGLDFVVPLFLVATVVPKATTGPVRTAVLTGAVAAVAGTVVPLHLGSATGIVAGVAAGLWHGRRTR
jgi:predicted branched-subunit amino acid permease